MTVGELQDILAEMLDGAYERSDRVFVIVDGEKCDIDDVVEDEFSIALICE